MPVPKRLFEAAISAAQAVIIPIATVGFAVSALALMPRRKFVTAKQAAEYLNTSPRTIRNKISEGVLTGYRLPGPDGRAIRLDLNEIDALMQRIPAVIQRHDFGPDARIVAVKPEELADQDQDDGGDEA